jgi:hypothetical protein
VIHGNPSRTPVWAGNWRSIRVRSGRDFGLEDF